MLKSFQSSFAHASTGLSDDATFKEARQNFLDSLPEKWRSTLEQCSSAEEVIAYVQGLTSNELKKTKGVLSKITLLKEKLEPYFASFGILVSSNPQYAALVWGTFRLVLQLASNFSTFFEKVTDITSQIANRLPHFGRIAKLADSLESEALKAALCNVYTAMLKLFQSIVAIFVKSNGSRKRSIVVFGSLVWQPFDVRFRNLMETLENCDRFLKDELVLSSFETTNRVRKVVEGKSIGLVGQFILDQKRRNDIELSNSLSQQQLDGVEELLLSQKVTHIQGWLDAGRFVEDYERIIGFHEEGTCLWALESEMFSSWASSPHVGHDSTDQDFGTETLWLHGAPGSGKSTLAAAAIEALTDSQTESEALQDIYYYFFSSVNRVPTRTEAYQALLSQILNVYRTDPLIIDTFMFVIIANSRMQRLGTQKQLLDLLQIFFSSRPGSVLILDGIDELGGEKDPFIEDLRGKNIPRYAKLLLVSRPNVASLRKHIPESRQISMEKLYVSEDIKTVCQQTLEGFADEGILPQGTHIPELVDHLVTGADGMFLWMRLMLTYLESPAFTPSQRVTTILNVSYPEGLDEMYGRVARLLANAPDVERNLTKQIFMWLMCNMRPLTGKELQEIILFEQDRRRTHKDGYLDLRLTVVLTCGGLVEPRTGSCDSLSADFTFSFVHETTKEFIQRQMGSAAHEYSFWTIFPSSVQQLYLSIATLCLEYLNFRLQEKPLAGTLCTEVDPKKLLSELPFIAYASVYWQSHIQLSFEPSTCRDRVNDNIGATVQTLCQVLNTFLSKRLNILAWIEACYVLNPKTMSDITTKSPELLASWLKGAPAKISTPEIILTVADYNEFNGDMSKLDAVMRDSLIEYPSSIWTEAPAFVRSRFLVQTSATRVTHLARPENAPKGSPEPMFTISQTANDGNFLGKLSIWPSSSFISFSQNSEDNPATRDLFLDWNARYELWSVSENPHCVLDLSWALDQKEVWLAVCQSLSEGRYRKNELTMRFPLVISNNCKAVVVLRTLYTVVFSGGSEPRLVTRRLPMDSHASLQRPWALKQTEHKPFYFDAAETYHYAITFSPDDRLLSFSNVWSRNKPVIAVFDIPKKENDQVRLRSVLADVFKKSTIPWNGDLPRVLLHPHASLLFVVVSSQVWMWQFDHSLSPCDHLASLDRPDKDVKLSKCGKHIVSNCACLPPLIITILPDVIERNMVLESRPHALITQPHMEISAVKAEAGALVTTQFREDGIVQVASDGKGASISTWDLNTLQKKSLRITGLPAEMKNKDVSVRWPQHAEESVRIIVNQPSQSKYTLKEGKEFNPMVIERDQRTVGTRPQTASASRANTQQPRVLAQLTHVEEAPETSTTPDVTMTGIDGIDNSQHRHMDNPQIESHSTSTKPSKSHPRASPPTGRPQAGQSSSDRQSRKPRWSMSSLWNLRPRK